MLKKALRKQFWSVQRPFSLHQCPQFTCVMCPVTWNLLVEWNSCLLSASPNVTCRLQFDQLS